MCSLNLEPRKHTALHQIHKIMSFLATSYDPLQLSSKQYKTKPKSKQNWQTKTNQTKKKKKQTKQN